MSKSKCTCAHRLPSQGVRDWNFTHNPDCHYAEVRKQEAQAREDKRINEALYKHYRRQGKAQS